MHEPRIFQHTTSLTDIRQLWREICEGETLSIPVNVGRAGVFSAFLSP